MFDKYKPLSIDIYGANLSSLMLLVNRTILQQQKLLFSQQSI
jgi:hypothetical protein